MSGTIEMSKNAVNSVPHFVPHFVPQCRGEKRWKEL